MLKIKVKYHLNDEGMDYFPFWYHEVFEISRQQDGFLEMNAEEENSCPVIYLYFENQEKLRKWADTEIHDELAAKIEAYFIEPKEVSFSDLIVN